MDQETKKRDMKDKIGKLYGYRYHIALVFALMFLLHYPKLNAGLIGIDTESMIRRGSGFARDWLVSGRQGIVFLKGIFGVLSFNPYFAATMTMVTLPAAVCAFFLLWDGLRGDKSSIAVWFLGGLLWLSHPVMAEIMYFSMISFEVVFSFLLAAAAVACAQAWVDNRKQWLYLGAGTALLVVVFSVYQAMVPFYIFGVVSVLYLRAVTDMLRGKKESLTAALGQAGLHLAVFLLAFLLNQGITAGVAAYFGDGSAYLTKQIAWGTVPAAEVLCRIVRHIGRVCLGSGAFYSIFYGVLGICSLVLLALHTFRKRKETGSCAAVWLLWLSQQLTPFLMTVLLGGEPVIRSQLVLPAMTAFQAMTVLWMAERLDVSQAALKRAAVGAGAVICLLGGMKTAKITWGFYYSDQMRYEQDQMLGYALIQRIEQVCGEEARDLPVVIVGKRPFQGNNSSTDRGQMIGEASFFCWDTAVEPVPYFSTQRVLGFLHTLGADYVSASPEKMQEALEDSAGMPSWPLEGSVQIINGMVIVKLSEAGM